MVAAGAAAARASNADVVVGIGGGSAIAAATAIGALAANDGQRCKPAQREAYTRRAPHQQDAADGREP